LIKAAKGAQLVHMNNADQCCGFGGEFSVAYPDISNALVESKVKCYLESGADILVLGEPGCLLNINGYLERNHPEKRAMHIAEFLAEQGEHHGC
jgi:L-lactate dehydrogenase complex protein LldE